MSDDEIIGMLANAADALDATRVHEMVDGKWLSTTIFTGDAAALRFARMVEKAAHAAGMRAGIERAAEVCEEVADRHRANNDRTWPERNRSEGQDGASDCEAAIRALLEGKG